MTIRNRLRAWLRKRKRRREVAEAWALDIFGVSTEGLSESEVARRYEELNRRIAEEWRAIEDAAL